MKQVHRRGMSILLMLGLSVVFPTGATSPFVTPEGMRGIWFEASEMGQHLCLQYRLRRTGELVPGTLVIADNQIAEMTKAVQEDVLFLTNVASLGDDAWQVTGLLDTYPYEKLKELKSFGFTLRDGSLYRSHTQVKDGQEFMQTQTYRRCL